MLHSAQLYREASQFELFGLHTENTSFDWEKIHQRKKEVVTKLRGGIEQLIKANKIDFFNKSASILGKNDVQLGQGEEILHAENILIATGSVPARPPIPGLDLPGVVTSDELLDDPQVCQADSLAKEILIIGGGVIGMEFASVFASLGCKVTIVEAMERILPTMDREISQSLGMLLKKRGVAIHTGAMVEKIEPGGRTAGLLLYRKRKGPAYPGPADSGRHRPPPQYAGTVCRAALRWPASADGSSPTLPSAPALMASMPSATSPPGSSWPTWRVHRASARRTSSPASSRRST